MIRGTTPTLQFNLPCNASDLTEAFITIVQVGEKKIEKELADCIATEKKLEVTLTQAETLLLDERYPVEIQMRVKIGGTAAATKIWTVEAGRILKEGEI